MRVCVCTCVHWCVCVCMRVYTCVHRYACVYVLRVCVCPCVQKCVCVCMYVYMYACVYVCVCMGACLFLRVWVGVCMYACVYLCLWVCVCACTCLFGCVSYPVAASRLSSAPGEWRRSPAGGDHRERTPGEVRGGPQCQHPPQTDSAPTGLDWLRMDWTITVIYQDIQSLSTLLETPVHIYSWDLIS